MEKKTNRDNAGWIWILIGSFFILFAGCQIFSDDLERLFARNQYNEIQEDYVETDFSPNIEEKKDWWSTNVRVEFARLKQKNPDIKAWIRFDDPTVSGVNYPILYSGNNNDYLNKDPYGKENIAGSIFIEEKNHPEFLDYYTIIYGHNMMDGSMFGKLKQYRDQAFYNANPCFTVYTENIAYRYQIFSSEDTVSGSDVYKVGYKPGEEYQMFIDRMIRDSYIQAPIVPKNQDLILTLSTCAENDSNERFAVHAVCVDKQATDRLYDQTDEIKE